MLHIKQIEQKRRRQNRKYRSEKSVLERNQNKKYQRIIEVPLVHPRREHEESEQRDENREQRGRRRSRPPHHVRRDEVNGERQRKSERAVGHAEYPVGIGRFDSAEQSMKIKRADRSLAEPGAEILVNVERPVPRMPHLKRQDSERD